MYASDASDGIRESPIVDHIFSTDASGQLKASAILAQHSLDVGAREDLGNRWSAQWSEKGQEDTNIKPTDASSDSDCDSDSDCPVIPPPRATQSTVALREQILARTLFELREVGFKLSDLGDHLQQSSITHLSNDQRKEVGIGRGQLRHFVMQLDKLLDLPDVAGIKSSVMRGANNEGTMEGPGVGCTSRQLRQIALATPGLWSSISLDARDCRPGEGHGRFSRGWSVVSDQLALDGGVPAELVKKWLSRAGCCPLSITFRSTHFRVNTRVISALVKFASHWRRLELELPPKDMTYLEQTRGATPMLREVAFISPLESGLDFRNSPALSQVRILSITPVSRVQIGMDALTSLQIDGCIEFTEFKRILSVCPALIHFKLSDVGAIDDEQQILAPHPLRSLAIKSDSYLLNLLILPTLQRLEIPFEDTKTLLDFMERSACCLRHLHFTRIDIYHRDDLLQCLEVCSSLSTLELKVDFDWCNYGDEVCHDLSRPDLLPELTALKIIEPSAFQMNFHTLTSTLTARRKQNPRLVNLEIHVRDDSQWNKYQIRGMYREFEELVAMGLRVRVKNISGGAGIDPDIDTENFEVYN
ncbi:hypothetical protein C8R43DRAFT_1107745 [Mycena crocata]|nr:hypothetical protein C8R43DRAFT_1107745 [Mycena crocata]